MTWCVNGAALFLNWQEKNTF